MELRRTLAAGDYTQIEGIYVASFPPELRVPVVRLIRPDPSRWWVIAADGDVVVGFAVVLQLGTSRSALLEYLAVREDRRNNGTGGMLVDEVVRLGRELDVAHLLVEVKPKDSHDEYAARRLGFYARHGVLPHPCVPHYQVPDLTGAEQAGTPLVLLYRPVEDGAPRLDAASLKEVLVSVWQCSYGADADDPLLERVISATVC